MLLIFYNFSPHLFYGCTDLFAVTGIYHFLSSLTAFIYTVPSVLPPVDLIKFYLTFKTQFKYTLL